MNGRVRREYVQRLSKNLTNQELGLRSMEEEEEDYDSARFDGKRNREVSAQAEYRKKYNQTLKAVQKNKQISYKLKRRKIAPSLQKKKNNRFRVSSPYFPTNDDDDDDDGIVSEEEEEEEMSSSSSSNSMSGGRRRSLGRMAASKYPISGLLDSLGLPSIGLKLGQSSFDVDAIKKLPGDIPREDGFDEADLFPPFGKEWQSKEFQRQELLEADLNYRFIYLLAGNVSSSVTKLYDEDRLEDMLLRRMNIRNQLQLIHRIEEKKIPELQKEILRLKKNVVLFMNFRESEKSIMPHLNEAKIILNNINKIQTKINGFEEEFNGLISIKNLLFDTENSLSTISWMAKLKTLKIDHPDSVARIKECANFFYNNNTEKKLELELQKDIKTKKSGNLLRVLFVCLAHFVALLWERIEVEMIHETPTFSGNTAMEQWKKIVAEDSVLFELKFPTFDLNNKDAYSEKMGFLRNIWISYRIPNPKEEEEEEEEEEIDKEFSEWIARFEKNIVALEKQKILLQEQAKNLLENLEDFNVQDILPGNLDQWEDALYHWITNTEQSFVDVKIAIFALAEAKETAEKKLKDMETVRPARVEYQHRKGWAMRPEHSGHIPLDAKVVAGIEAAMDVMRDVKNELRGARASYIINVLRAGANQLQHSPLSRAAFAKLVASRMALQEEYFPTTWTRKEQMGRVRMWAASALRSLSNLRWTGTKLVDRHETSSLHNRILMQPATSLW